MSEVTPEQIIEAARKRWPEADEISLTMPTFIWRSELWQIGEYRVTRAVYGIHTDSYQGLGDSTLAALLHKIEQPQETGE